MSKFCVNAPIQDRKYRRYSSPPRSMPLMHLDRRGNHISSRWFSHGSADDFYDNLKLSGASPSSSFLMLAANSNSDLLEGQNFASQTGSGSFTGIINFEMEDIGLDGNAGANTGSNSGLIGIGTGDGVRIRTDWGIFTNRVWINNFAADGWHSEWNTAAGDPSNGVKFRELIS